jgi:biopolymer transport protein ExbB
MGISTPPAGMVVAIPALIAYRYFQRKIVDIAMQLETQGNQLINILFYSEVKPSHLSVNDHLQHPDQGLHYEAS